MEPSTRRVVTRSPGRTVRILNLRGLLSAPLECESSLERDFAIRAALHPAVVNITAQPFRLRLGEKTYTPDFLVELKPGKRMVVEVKTRRKIPQYQPLFDAASVDLHRHGMHLLVADERAIRAGGAHRRAARILRFLKAAFAFADCERALAVAATYATGLSIGQLMREARVGKPLVLHLIATRRLHTGADLAIHDAAHVRCVTPIQESTHEHHFAQWFGLAPWTADAGARA